MLMILMEKKKKSERKVCQIEENVYICNRKPEKVTIMTVNMFTAWWWRYSRFNKS